MQVYPRSKNSSALAIKVAIWLLVSYALIGSSNTAQYSASAANALPPVIADDQAPLSSIEVIKLDPQEHLPRLLAQNTDTTYSVAQSITLGEIRGKIIELLTDQPLLNAYIVLSKVGEEHKRYQTESLKNGIYAFTNIAPGQYTVTVSATDKLSETRNVTVASGTTETLDFKLEELEGTDILRVTGKRTLIHPHNIGSETNLDHDIINQYQSVNDLQSLIKSTPGVVSDTYGNIITRGEHNSINYVLDDVVLPEAAGVLQQSQFVSPRSLQSMKVDIGGYQAEDGGGPMGAVVHMKSLPIQPQPYFTSGMQMGSPIAGSFWYSGSTAFSQNPDSPLYKLRVESSGSVVGTSMGNAPPIKNYVDNNRCQLNLLSKLEYLITERDRVNVTLGINESFMRVPTSPQSAAAGVDEHQHDAQDYIILNYKHKFAHFFDEGNLHILNAFYYTNFHSNNVFDPNPVINGGQPLWSIAPNALRFDYVFSAQGDISKILWHTHFLKAGFLSEFRPCYTDFGGTYYNNNPNTPGVPYGAVISPFTGTTSGPQFTSAMGKLHSSRYLQSAYLQDSWRPQKGVLKRLTLDTGVRLDVYHGYFGNTLPVANAIATIPGASPFNIQPFLAQQVTDAAVNGRFGASFVLTKTTVLRASYSDIFEPPQTDVFSTPPFVAGGFINGPFNGIANGIYNGTVRPMRAARGRLIDVSLEQQIGPRFVARNNLFYKTLTNYGDSGVIGNSTLYNRQSVAAQEAYGVETRLDLKPGKEGKGFYGFVSNTVSVAYLRGSKQVSGGIYDIQGTPVEDKYPDHDRRVSLVAGLGYKTKKNFWVLADMQFMTGLQNETAIAMFYAYPLRTPNIALFNISTGFRVPQKIKRRFAFMPEAFDLRIQNLLDTRAATNAGSPFQGTRFLLPFRFLIGCNWTLGKEPVLVNNTKTTDAKI